jgi:glycosyltransferase involved in cell wall biosynthesis
MMAWYYRVVPKIAAQHAAAVITVSHAAKASIVEQLHLNQERIFVTHEAASPLYRRIDDPSDLEAVRQKYGLGHFPFILAIGSADPRKNIETLVRAFAALPDQLRAHFHLAIVWTHSLLAEDLARQIETLGIRDQVHFLKQVPDNDLVLLYNAASLFVFPSLYEGFGLPPLEAMACGTPIIAANNSSIPEIVGEATLLSEARDADAIMKLIMKVLTDDCLRQELIAKGLKRAATFSWEKCGLETLQVYQQVVTGQG